MQRPYVQIQVDKRGQVCCVRLKNTLFDDEALEQFGAELARLVDEDGCTRIVLDLGSRELQCLYSLFLAKLIHLQRRLEASGGGIVLAEVTPYIRELFQVTGLEKMFRFFPDEESAVQAFSA